MGIGEKEEMNCLTSPHIDPPVHLYSRRAYVDPRPFSKENHETTQYIAFLRAINVGGHASIKMNILKNLFLSAGCTNVRTVIQSGNVLFEAGPKEAPAITWRIQTRLNELLGSQAMVFFRKCDDLEQMVKKNSFNHVKPDSNVKLYVSFLSQKSMSRSPFPIDSPQEALEVFKIEGLEVFIISRKKKNGMYGFPNNFIEKELGVLATTRNWSTIKKIVELSNSHLKSKSGVPRKLKDAGREDAKK